MQPVDEMADSRICSGNAWDRVVISVWDCYSSPLLFFSPCVAPGRPQPLLLPIPVEAFAISPPGGPSPSTGGDRRDSAAGDAGSGVTRFWEALEGVILESLVIDLHADCATDLLEPRKDEEGRAEGEAEGESAPHQRVGRARERRERPALSQVLILPPSFLLACAWRITHSTLSEYTEGTTPGWLRRGMKKALTQRVPIRKDHIALSRGGRRASSRIPFRFVLFLLPIGGCFCVPSAKHSGDDLATWVAVAPPAVALPADQKGRQTGTRGGERREEEGGGGKGERWWEKVNILMIDTCLGLHAYATGGGGAMVGCQIWRSDHISLFPMPRPSNVHPPLESQGLLFYRILNRATRSAGASRGRSQEHLASARGIWGGPNRNSAPELWRAPVHLIIQGLAKARMKATLFWVLRATLYTLLPVGSFCALHEHFPVASRVTRSAVTGEAPTLHATS